MFNTDPPTVAPEFPTHAPARHEGNRERERNRDHELV
jgi:hypothetical protein